MIAAPDIFVVTDARHAPLVREALPALPPGNVLGEPEGRNTAAAVALAAHAVDRPADEVMVVMPADQAVADDVGLREALAAAAQRALEGDMVTLGVTPTGPQTGYGYVVARGEAARHAGRDTYRVARFEEKPTPERAGELISAGTASWNAGIFVWRRDTLREGLDRHAPAISRPIAGWAAARPGPVRAVVEGDDRAAEGLAAVYAALPATSIDYALMEPASLEGRVAVVPMAVGWSDLGSWSALRDARGDGSGSANVTQVGRGAQVVEVASQGVFVQAEGGRLVALVGLRDVIVVDTEDALLVCAPDAAQDVKQVVERLRDAGRDDLL
jgi:mannose-1-phosphate guanylyltransferase